MNLEDAINKYAKANKYPATRYDAVACSCGSDNFKMFSDDEEGGVYLVCAECGEEHDIENSRGYIEKACQNVCNCDQESLQVGVGKSFYEGTDDPRWIYVGAKCPGCGLAGVYVDWNER